MILILFLLLTGSSQDLGEVLTRHFEAVGQEQLSSFRSAIISGRIIQNNQQEYNFTTYIKRPNKIRKELELPNEIIIKVYDGQEGWHKDFNNLISLSSEEKKKLQLENQIDSPLNSIEASGTTLTYMGEKTIVNDTYHQIKATGGEGITHYFIDVKTNLLYRITKETPDRNRDIMEITYLNYRKLGRIQVPMIINSIGPKGRIQTFVDEIAFDAAVSNALFHKP